jgi:queuine/archaeosine tRNA-ribosyltransferase
MGAKVCGEDDNPREKKACNTASRRIVVDIFKTIDLVVKQFCKVHNLRYYTQCVSKMPDIARGMERRIDA